MRANLIKLNLLRFLPSRKAINHFVMSAVAGKVAKFHVEELGDLALGDLPSIGERDAR